MNHSIGGFLLYICIDFKVSHILPILNFQIMRLTFTSALFLIVFVMLKAQNAAPEAVNSVGTNGTLTVFTNTAPVGGNRANASAYWIEDSNHKLVNTMMYYTTNTTSTAMDLLSWWKQIVKFQNKDISTNVDLISGPTQTKPLSRTCYWGKTVSLADVPDGDYTVFMEFADGIAVGYAAGPTGHEVVSYTFTKGPNPSVGVRASQEYTVYTLTGDDYFPNASKCFSGTLVGWEPSTTSVDKLNRDAMYAVYPNPTRSTVFFDGLDIKYVEIFSQEGKSLIKSNQQKINLNALLRGTYLAHIYTPYGVVVKKIIRE